MFLHKQAAPEESSGAAFWCPRSDLNGDARLGTGPQPAAYANSATGANCTVIISPGAFLVNPRQIPYNEEIAGFVPPLQPLGRRGVYCWQGSSPPSKVAVHWITVTIRIISDSSCNVPDSYQQSLGIIQVPAWVNFADGASLRNGIDISDAEFYRRLQNEKRLPTTSQPTPQDFIDIIHTFDPEDQVILACVSSKMSGTYNSAVQARDALPQADIFLYDTLSVSMGGAWQIIAGAEAAVRGADVETVLQAMESSRSRVHIYFTIDTLKYLAASGRAPTLQAIMGNLLDIKPMMNVQDGTLALVGKVRGRKKSKRELMELVAVEVGDKPLRLAVVNANAPDEAAELAEAAKERLNVQEMLVVDLGPVLGALTGPGTLAFGAFVQE